MGSQVPCVSLPLPNAGQTPLKPSESRLVERFESCDSIETSVLLAVDFLEKYIFKKVTTEMNILAKVTLSQSQGQCFYGTNDFNGEALLSA